VNNWLDARRRWVVADLLPQCIDLLDLEGIAGGHQEGDTRTAMGTNNARHIPADARLPTVSGGNHVSAQTPLAAMLEVGLERRGCQVECCGRRCRCHDGVFLSVVSRLTLANAAPFLPLS